MTGKIQEFDYWRTGVKICGTEVILFGTERGARMAKECILRTFDERHEFLKGQDKPNEKAPE